MKIVAQNKTQIPGVIEFLFKAVINSSLDEKATYQSRSALR